MNVAETILTALVSGTGGWAVLQFFLTRASRKAEIARQHAAAEKDLEDAARSKTETSQRESKLLADAQIVAQRTALESGQQRYAELRMDYEETRTSLKGLRNATEALIDAVDALIVRMRPNKISDVIMLDVSIEEYRSAREAIAEARRHLR